MKKVDLVVEKGPEIPVPTEGMLVTRQTDGTFRIYRENPTGSMSFQWNNVTEAEARGLLWQLRVVLEPLKVSAGKAISFELEKP